jgi:hypothetical protein
LVCVFLFSYRVCRYRNTISINGDFRSRLLFTMSSDCSIVRWKVVVLLFTMSVVVLLFIMNSGYFIVHVYCSQWTVIVLLFMYIVHNEEWLFHCSLLFFTGWVLCIWNIFCILNSSCLDREINCPSILADTKVWLKQ